MEILDAGPGLALMATRPFCAKCGCKATALLDVGAVVEWAIPATNFYHHQVKTANPLKEAVAAEGETFHRLLCPLGHDWDSGLVVRPKAGADDAK